MHERVIESRRNYEGRVVNLRVDTVELRNGHVATREVVEHSQAVAIVPVADDGRIVMVRQYRLPAGAELLEVPAGSLDGGEDAESGAQRELQEETGFAAGRLVRLCGFWVAPGYCTEYIHVYLAEQLRESRLDADEDEEVEVELLTLEDALARVDRGEIEDAKSLVGLLAYARRLASI
jgi:8-oxo-dGTP pyrophosphatase MutT (NUDIX family)